MRVQEKIMKKLLRQAAVLGVFALSACGGPASDSGGAIVSRK
jgi:hypothetical protein